MGFLPMPGPMSNDLVLLKWLRPRHVISLHQRGIPVAWKHSKTAMSFFNVSLRFRHGVSQQTLFCLPSRFINDLKGCYLDVAMLMPSKVPP